jgi:glycosyltransferase involved in cell wall biosynthesis
VKYHNVTPPEFFAPYSDIYRHICDEGRKQTARMAKLGSIARWQCDSLFNALEVGELGVAEAERAVVPPFTRCDEIMRNVHAASYPPEGPFTAFFIGRRVPNKGHAHILRTAAAWRDLFPESRLHCRMVGATDANLSGYFEELRQLERRLGLEDRIEWLDHVSDDEVARFYRTSHAYLNLTEHEGFCVPLVEAQALGLPTLSTNVAALTDTLGPGQVTVPVPTSDGDYDVLAGLLHEICTSPPLRSALVRAGCANVYGRFTSRIVENLFLADLEPLLQAIEA